MHFSRASWLLTACMAVANASGVLEVDLVFPLNETYAPTQYFPVVFAFQNPQRAQHLNPSISYTIRTWDGESWGGDTISESHDLRDTNWTSVQDPYLVYTYLDDFNAEGQWKLDWQLTWQSCDEEALSQPDPDDAKMISNSSSWGTLFTIQKAAPAVDLVAATANESCPGEFGATINVTDKTMRVPLGVNWSGRDAANSTCAVVASSTPTPTPDPCRVSIDSAAAASMSASLTATLCKGLNPPENCPTDENAAQQLGVFGVSLVLAVLGALGFFFM